MFFLKKYVFCKKHGRYLVGAGLSGSLSCCHFLCVLSRGSFTFASYTHSIHFVQKTRSVGTSWAPASQGPSLAATFYATSLGVLLLLQVTHIRLFLSCLGVICSGGTPGRVFLHFFRKVFGPARVRISLAFTLRSGFVATSKKCAHVWAHKGANMLHGRRSHA